MKTDPPSPAQSHLDSASPCRTILAARCVDSAAHANDPAAESFFANDPFYRFCQAVLPYAN